MKKKFLGTLLSAAVLFTLILGFAPNAEAQVEHPFTDVPSGLTPAVNYVYENQYMSGFPDNTFRPDANIKRAQAANALWRKAGSPAVTTGDCPAEWQDVIGNWAEEAICWMLQQGYANGYPDGTFRPEGNLTRAQAAVWVGNAHRVVYTGGSCSFTGTGPNFSDYNQFTWAVNEVCGLNRGGVLDGYSDNTFRPSINMSRGQYTNLIYKLRNVVTGPCC